MKIATSVPLLISQYYSSKSGYWFDDDTLKFFDSRIGADYKRLSDDIALFITSEKGPSGIRRWTLRCATVTPDNKISILDIGPFNKFTYKRVQKIMSQTTLEHVMSWLKIEQDETYKSYVKDILKYEMS